MKKFEDLTLEELKELYEKVIGKEEKKDSLAARPRTEDGRECYYYCCDYGETGVTTEMGFDGDNFRYETGNYFLTKAEAEEYKKKLILQQQYKDWCRFNIDWNNDGQAKWYCTISKGNICYNWQKFTKTQGVVYAKSEERIKEFIDKVGEDDFKKYILEVEE